MEESQQFKAYQDGLRAKNVNSCNALLSRLARFHGEEFVKVAPVIVIEAPAPAPMPAPPPPEVAPIAECISQIEEDGPRKATIREIQKCVSKHFNISMNELLSSRRFAKIVRPRQVGFYLARKLTARSLPEIGRKFGGKDHTTILHACKKVEERMATDPDLARTVAELEAMFA